MFQYPPTISSEDQDMQFHFIVQDRPVVVGLGLAAWRGQCPEMLESRQVVFQGRRTGDGKRWVEVASAQVVRILSQLEPDDVPNEDQVAHVRSMSMRCEQHKSPHRAAPTLREQNRMLLACPAPGDLLTKTTSFRCCQGKVLTFETLYAPRLTSCASRYLGAVDVSILTVTEIALSLRSTVKAVWMFTEHLRESKIVPSAD
ncbi:hypothetical protein M405DRAFT_846550 [Rhizopogon salebrosus TDB-379]|nr:hypothetical protein M405DRAFT_846550 [Rhizopogon salebrosus TDB-379]